MHRPDQREADQQHDRQRDDPREPEITERVQPPD
jgi:hypothetical protein